MLKNYLMTALRNLSKNKSYAFISIFGLSIGLGICLLLLLYIQQELSYDCFNKNADNIYRLYQPVHPYHAPVTAKALADNFPEVKDYARILIRDNAIVSFENKRFKEKSVALADANLFRIFSYKFISGNPSTALINPNSVVINKTIANKYFGNDNAIGKTIKINNQMDYTITGVMEDMPENSHLKYDIIFTLADADKIFGSDWMNNWGWQNFLVYFLMQEGFDKAGFEEKASSLIHNLSASKEAKISYYLQNIKDIHLFSKIEYDIPGQNTIGYVLIFSGIGLLILLIACFNYINLLTANATTRSKEIGIRKVIGASRKHLSMQFLGESVIVLLISALLSTIFVISGLPLFNALSGKSLNIGALLNVEIILGSLAIIIFTTILAGFYPAFILSDIQPVKAIKASLNTGKTNFNLRKLLVGVQFTIVIILICLSIFMSDQIDYLGNKELGFNKEYILVSEIDNSFGVEKFNTLKQNLLKEKEIINVTTASRIPSNQLNNGGGVLVSGHNKVEVLPYVHMHQDYFETFGLKVAKGRLFSNKLQTDENEAIILNESAVKKLGIKGNPIGQTLSCSWPASKRKIVGIIKDFHFESLYENIKPAVFVMDYKECYQLIIRIKPSNAGEIVPKIEKICNTFYPDHFFEFSFLDEQLGLLYQSDNNTFKLMSYFSFIAIFISCMGLFGLSFFMIKSKTKEIGVRKVLGASILNVLLLLSKDFTKWVIIANIIAWPVAFGGVSKWLENFAYKIDITFWPFLLAGIIAFIIVIVTISFQIIRAATANPIKSIKYE